MSFVNSFSTYDNHRTIIHPNSNRRNVNIDFTCTPLISLSLYGSSSFMPGSCQRNPTISCEMTIEYEYPITSSQLNLPFVLFTKHKGIPQTFPFTI